MRSACPLQSGTESRFHSTGFPWQTGQAESPVSRLRIELPDVEVFFNVATFHRELAFFRRYSNEHRPRSSGGNGPPVLPAKFLKQAQGPPIPPSNLGCGYIGRKLQRLGDSLGAAGPLCQLLIPFSMSGT